MNYPGNTECLMSERKNNNLIGKILDEDHDMIMSISAINNPTELQY